MPPTIAVELDKEQIRAELHAQLDHLIPELYPEATKSATGWRVGNADGERGSSFSITTTGPKAGLWQDFADQSRSGDVFDLIRERHGLNFQDALNWARKYVGSPTGRSRATAADHRPTHKNPSVNPETEGPAEWLTTFAEQASAALELGESPEAQQALAYITKRRLANQAHHFGVVDRSVSMPEHFSDGYKSGMQGRLLIISRDVDGQPAYYNARDLTGKVEEGYKYLKPAGTRATVPFNAGAIEAAQDKGFLVLTEGELDAASILEAFGPDYPVMGCSGGKLPEGWYARVADADCKVFLLFDNDQAGRTHAEKLTEKLTRINEFKTVHAAFLTGHKDAGEALQALGPDGLAKAVSAAVEDAAVAPISDLLYVTSSLLTEMDERHDRTLAYYTTGIPQLDALLGGGYVEGLHLIGGITGGGKTSLALSIAIANALKGHAVIYASYEQSKLELWGRIANRITNIPRGAFKTGRYNERDGTVHRASSVLQKSKDWDTLQRIARRLKIVEGGDALSREQGSWGIDKLTDTAQRIADTHGAPPLIIVDYLQRVPVPEGMKIRDVRERVGAVSGMLQVKLGRALSAPILALSSVGRASYNAEHFSRAPVEDRMQAFKEAGELEYTAYSALLLYRLPETKWGPVMHPGPAKVHNPRVLDLVKNREGEPGRLAVKWYPWRDEWRDAIDYGGENDSV